MLSVVFGVTAAAFGACVGSFLNVVIYRLPQEDPALRSLGGRSRCPSCGAQIALRDNVPIFGWLLLRGRARCCGAKFSVRYALVELLTAAMFLMLALWPPHGAVIVPAATGVGETWSGAALAALLFDAAFVAFLIANTFIDWDHRILPDALTKPFMALGIAAALVSPGYAGFLGEVATPGDSLGRLSPAIGSLLASAAGLGAGFGLTYAISVGATRLFRKPAMGFGDVKFMGAVGAFLGWQGALLTFFLGCVAGAVGGVAHRAVTGDAYVPFGPFLALGAAITLFEKDAIVEFLFHTWPEWQRTSDNAPALMIGLFVLCVVALLVLVRRGRSKG